MATFRHGRAAGTLAVCLLLLSSLAATSALAGAAPPRSSSPRAVAVIIGTGSCGGFGACQNVTGPIGDNSCNGDSSCIDWTGSIGDNSCNYEFACEDGSASIGDNSCSGLGACAAATGSIGDNSCNGYTQCSVTDATIGDCMFNDVYPAVCVQPDARIRRVGRTLYGNDVYNIDGVNQTLTPARTTGRKLRVVITVENDGVAPEFIHFRREFVRCDDSRFRCRADSQLLPRLARQGRHGRRYVRLFQYAQAGSWSGLSLAGRDHSTEHHGIRRQWWHQMALPGHGALV